MEFNIKDGGGKLVGVAQVRTSGGVLMEGSFSPSPHFETYAALFRAQDGGTLQDDIDGHGFTAEGPLPLPGSARIHDLRISDSGTNLQICFRFPPPTTANAPVDA